MNPGQRPDLLFASFAPRGPFRQQALHNFKPLMGTNAMQRRLTRSEYFKEMVQSKFTLSPPGIFLENVIF